MPCTRENMCMDSGSFTNVRLGAWPSRNLWEQGVKSATKPIHGSGRLPSRPAILHSVNSLPPSTSLGRSSDRKYVAWRILNKVQSWLGWAWSMQGFASWANSPTPCANDCGVIRNGSGNWTDHSSGRKGNFESPQASRRLR